MKKICLLVFTALIMVGAAFTANAQAADNGLSGESAAGPMYLGPIDPLIGGPWLEFLFRGPGSFAEPCFGACVPSSGGNSVELTSFPPWTFTVGTFGGATLTATDAFANGDIFDLFDFGGYIGSTSIVAPAGSCGSDPAICFPDPLSSSGTFFMAVGAHAIDLVAAVSPFGGGAAYFRVDLNATFIDMDIKFCSNPNAFNSKQKGATPVTIFGSATFDVTAIDRDTLQLCNDAAGLDCTPSGLKSFSMADRGDPTTDLGAAQCALIDTDGDGVPDTEVDWLNPDGFLDLDAAFYSRDVAALIGPVSKGDVVGPLYLVGTLFDGSPFTSVPVISTGVDLLVIKK
jgi:hypothetical protein